MRDNARRAWLVLAWMLLGCLSLSSTEAQISSPGKAPLPQTESSPSAGASIVPDAATTLRGTPPVLPVEEAFRLTALFEGDSILLLSWNIAPDHYLYREQFQFLDGNGRTVAAQFPAASTLTDEYFGETSVYFGDLQLRFPLSALPQTPEGEYLLTLTYQGCAKDRYCYPPTRKDLRLTLPR
jgi:thiol:disulfide interchange protein DsbD